MAVNFNNSDPISLLNNHEAFVHWQNYHLIFGQFALGCFVALTISNLLASIFDKIKAPYVGFRSIVEPVWLVRLRFAKGALPIINDGFQKFKDSMYRVCRNDKDLLVISNRFVDELRNLPVDRLNSVDALITNMAGDYSHIDIMARGHLSTKVLQSKLTPNLAHLTPIIKMELDYGLSKDVPECENEFVETTIYEVVVHLIARISNRIFVGDACRNQEWIEASILYAANVSTTVMILRCVPKFLHRIVTLFMPSVWLINKYIRQAQKTLRPFIEERLKAMGEPDFKPPADLLQWMIEMATPEECNAPELAHRQLVMSLASIHTTAMQTTHTLFDMIAHPEYIDPLREEVKQVLSEDGGWKKPTLTKMRKMDSFMKEAQRISPASLLGFHRIVKQSPLKLSDGTTIPVGTQLCVAVEAILKDKSWAEDCDEFDGFRYYKLRQQEENANKFQFAMTDMNHLHFGHGKQACPGRFFASGEIKMILGHLICNYELKFLPGQGRPENLNADEFLYADPSTKLLIKARPKEERLPRGKYTEEELHFATK